MKFFALLFVLLVGSQALASRVVRDTYTVFDDSNEALEWLKKERSSLYESAVSNDDPIYTEVRAHLATVWKGYQTLYPKRTADLPVPEIVITNVSNVDGYTLADSRGNMANMIYDWWIALG